MKAYRSLGRFRTGQPFRPWLLAHRGQRGPQRPPQRGTTKVPARAPRRWPSCSTRPREVADRDAKERVLAQVEALPDKLRAVVICRYLLELDEAETATVLRVPRGTVKSRLSRGLDRLRSALGSAQEVAACLTCSISTCASSPTTYAWRSLTSLVPSVLERLGERPARRWKRWVAGLLAGLLGRGSHRLSGRRGPARVVRLPRGRGGGARTQPLGRAHRADGAARPVRGRGGRTRRFHPGRAASARPAGRRGGVRRRPGGLAQLGHRTGTRSGSTSSAGSSTRWSGRPPATQSVSTSSVTTPCGSPRLTRSPWSPKTAASWCCPAASAPTLVWPRARPHLRLEGDLTRDRAIAIAESAG